MLRRIEPLALDVEIPPAPPAGCDDEGAAKPYVEWGDPASLYVDETYQRPIGDRGRGLIRRIVTGIRRGITPADRSKGAFSWRKFKMPVVTIDAEGRRLIVDGQHTATAAATRGINPIPWMVIQTLDTSHAADAFVGQNADRTAPSPMQEHRARVVARDEEALTVERVCERARVRLCLAQKKTGWEPRDTMALAAIRGLVNRHHAAGARRVLDICAGAQLAPITADHIKAVEALVFNPEFKGLVEDERLAALLTGDRGRKLEEEAATWAAKHRVRKWQGLTTRLYQVATGEDA